MNIRKCIIMVGPPGSGKGTQSKILSKELKIPHISTGDILRKEIQLKTNIGNEVDKLISQGELVSDNIIFELLSKRIDNKDCEGGYILDGIPRTINQLNKMTEIDICINYAIVLELDEEIIRKRINGRRVHIKSGRVYNLYFSPPKVEEIDDITGEELIHRSDDQLEVINKRISIYNNQTKPLLSNLEMLKNTKIIKINSERKLETITNELLSKIN